MAVVANGYSGIGRSDLIVGWPSSLGESIPPFVKTLSFCGPD